MIRNLVRDWRNRLGSAGKGAPSRGATALTYSLVVGLVSLAGISAVTRVGGGVDSLFVSVSSSLDGSAGRHSGDGSQTSSTPTAGSSCTDSNAPSDGAYTIDLATDPDGPFRVWCQDGWTLAAASANDGVQGTGCCFAPNAGALDANDLAPLNLSAPVPPEAFGRWKLSDATMAAIRAESTDNPQHDIRVRTVGAYGSGTFYHRADCTLTFAGVNSSSHPASHVCNLSYTASSGTSGQYQSGHWGMLSRWYNGQSYYILGIGSIHVSDSTHGAPTSGYCTFSDTRLCKGPTGVEVWVR